MRNEDIRDVTNTQDVEMFLLDLIEELHKRIKFLEEKALNSEDYAEKPSDYNSDYFVLSDREFDKKHGSAYDDFMRRERALIGGI